MIETKLFGIRPRLDLKGQRSADTAAVENSRQGGKIQKVRRSVPYCINSAFQLRIHRPGAKRIITLINIHQAIYTFYMKTDIIPYDLLKLDRANLQRIRLA